jgi:K+-transporting ATPase ATPase A chain
MTADLAANTAISFSTTTTWQAYGGEATLRYLTQLLGLVSQNFLAGAAGLAVGIAFIRGFAASVRPPWATFWVDLVRALLWVLLPLALVGSLVLIWQGVPLNWRLTPKAHTLEGGIQTIAQGPVAALEFIKNLGTNGGGFFNANGAHPYENPTPLVNFLGLLAIAVLPASLTITFGHMTGRPRAGWVLLAVMVVLFVGGLALCDFAEAATPPQLADLHVSGAGGNMEGKEVRFGIGDSVLAAVVTSNGATGSYNSMHDSYRPLGVLVPLVNMLLGEVVFGGLGTGLYSMIMIALVAVFLGGLMIGRTPEYLGKKITGAETRLAVLYASVDPAVVLVLTSLAIATNAGRAGLVTNTGTPGFTEVLFAYASSWPTMDRPWPASTPIQRVLQRDHCRRHAGGTIRIGRVSAGPGGSIRSPAALANDSGDAAQRFRHVRSPWSSGRSCWWGRCASCPPWRLARSRRRCSAEL